MKLDTRITELIATGASVAANCRPCLEYHVGKARESGADDEDITQAVEVGRLVRRGAAAQLDKFAAGLRAGSLPAAAGATGCCG